jgi:hypothetical protein
MPRRPPNSRRSSRWAGTAALELKTAAGDWDGAIRLLDSQKKAKQLERDAAKRKRAVLLTALAMEKSGKGPGQGQDGGAGSAPPRAGFRAGRGRGGAGAVPAERSAQGVASARIDLAQGAAS